jgi:hypothetical protein
LNKWSKKQVEKLLEYVESNASWKTISTAIGKPIPQCKGKLYNMGLRKNPVNYWEPLEDWKVWYYKKYENMNGSEIGKILNRNSDSVNSRCNSTNTQYT